MPPRVISDNSAIPNGMTPVPQRGSVIWRWMQTKAVQAITSDHLIKELGQCRDCNSPAIPGQTRCEKCAEAHRQSNRRSDARRRAAAKEADTARQADQAAGNGV